MRTSIFALDATCAAMYLGTALYCCGTATQPIVFHAFNYKRLRKAGTISRLGTESLHIYPINEAFRDPSPS